MEQKEDRREWLTRLLVCAAAALALYYAAEKWGGKLPGFPAEYLPWLRENRLQAIAVTAAVLFGASLVLLPLEAQDKEDPGEFVPCE